MIDGCDVWLSSSTFRFGNAVANLVKICPLLVVVATGRNGLFEKLVDVGEGWGGPNSQRISQRCYCQETVIRIPPLSNYHAATLLTHRCPRNFDASEMYGGLFVDFDEGNALQVSDNEERSDDCGNVRCRNTQYNVSPKPLTSPPTVA